MLIRLSFMRRDGIIRVVGCGGKAVSSFFRMIYEIIGISVYNLSLFEVMILLSPW